jgi:hypothetical protein
MFCVLPPRTTRLSFWGMSDRLAELRRQRALLTEHVAWLDREIAAEAGKAGSGDPPRAALPPAPAVGGSVSTGSRATVDAPATIFAPVSPASTPASRVTAGATDADAILNEYRVPSEALKTDVRKGCFLYFAVAMALLIGGVAILWVAFRHH